MFAEIKNGAVVTFPYDYDTLVRNNPYTKFNQTDLLSMYAGTESNINGGKLVCLTEIDSPVFNKQTQKIVRDSVPAFVNGVWALNLAIQDLTQVEQDDKKTAQAKSVRTSRNDKLKECDWTQVADSTADKTAWATYRQALRDITAQAGFPWAITWPDAP
jgi:hypothetical protein